MKCQACRRTFKGLNAYLWHFRVVNGCIPPAPPGPAHTCHYPGADRDTCPACKVRP